MLNWRKPEGTVLWESKGEYGTIYSIRQSINETLSFYDIVWLGQKKRPGKYTYSVSIYVGKTDSISYKKFKKLAEAKNGAEYINDLLKSNQPQKTNGQQMNSKEIYQLINLLIEDDICEETLTKIKDYKIEIGEKIIQLYGAKVQ